jgi:hypothetical protein
MQRKIVMKLKTYRQGDVLIEQVAKLPEKTKRVKREGGLIILARGEATGHHHSIFDRSCELLEAPLPALSMPQLGGPVIEPDRYLRVGTHGAAVEHQEHDTINLPGPAHYLVRRQREYSPDAIRNVAD